MTFWQSFKRRSLQVSRSREPLKIPPKSNVAHQLLEERQDEEISGCLDEAVRFIQDLLGPNDDFAIRHFRVFGRYPAALMNFACLVDSKDINSILRSLMHGPPEVQEETVRIDRLREAILYDSLYAADGYAEKRLLGVVESMLQGKTAILVEGMPEALVIGTRHIDKRSIDQPETEQVIRGSREGFIEMLQTNLSLMRYRLQTPDFRVKMLKIGRMTRSKVAVCYLEGVANNQLVEEVMNRLKAVDIDGVLDSGYLEQFIEDNHMSPFPQVQNTERPDKAVANMLEGRVIIMVDGSPFALIVPTVFSQFYQSVEDYSERFLLVSFIRLARVVALIFSLVFPSLYVAVISFNPELIPTEFAVAVAGARAGVPFPSVIEVLVMEVSMEVLREATLRLPQQVGGALSIVGVLVVGQAAVSAGFVSPITVVVVAMTTIGSFATPAYNAALALRLLRFPLVLLAGTFGLYGVMVGLILIANHLLSLRSFGVPYLSPIVPGNFEAMKDTMFRFPFWNMSKRPNMFHTPNRERIEHESVMRELQQAPSNTLDPLKVGNERRDISDGVSSPDNDSSGGDYSV